MVYLNGQMENNTKEVGKMVDNMEKVFQLIKKEEKQKLNGKMERELKKILESI